MSAEALGAHRDHPHGAYPRVPTIAEALTHYDSGLRALGLGQLELAGGCFAAAQTALMLRQDDAVIVTGPAAVVHPDDTRP